MGRNGRLAALATLGTLVAVLIGGGFLGALSGRLAVDFRLHYLPAAEGVLRGDPIYSLASATAGEAYAYPPQVAFLSMPFTLVPEGAAALLVLGVLVSLVIGTLWILGVRDPLCYLAVFAWAPTWQELDMASITPVLAFSLAYAWRHRERTGRPASALALAVPAKLFLWPIFVWTIATRRFRVTAYATALGVVLTLGLWAALDFQGLSDYPTLLQRLQDTNADKSYSIAAVVAWLNLPPIVGHVLMLGIGSVLIAGCVALARQRDDRGAFTLAIAAAMVLTPILWMHYLLLLIVPLAIYRPRFDLLWLLPIALWIGPGTIGFDDALPVMPLLVIAVIVTRVLSGAHVTLRTPVEPNVAAQAGTPQAAGV